MSCDCVVFTVVVIGFQILMTVSLADRHAVNELKQQVPFDSSHSVLIDKLINDKLMN